MENGKMTFRDVCNIAIPMLGYYGFLKGKTIDLVKPDLGLKVLNYRFSRKFEDNYVEAKDGHVEFYLNNALETYFENNTKEVLNEETGKYDEVFKRSREECKEDIDKLSEIYDDDTIEMVRKYAYQKTHPKKVKVKSNKALAYYL